MGEIGRLTPAQLDAVANALYPWVIFIDPIHGAKSNVNFSTIEKTTAAIHNAWKNSSGAQNDEIVWDVVLAAGTWDFEIISSKDNNRGIASIQFDGVEKGTIDMYAAVTDNNAVQSITGIVVPVTKKIALKIKMATKNVASIGFIAYIQSIRLLRTA